MGIPRNKRPESMIRCPSHRCGKAASVESPCDGRTLMLADASDAFLSSKGRSQSLNHKLIALGHTLGPTVLAETRVPPVFGLTNTKSLMTLLKTPGYQLRLLYSNIRRSQFPQGRSVRRHSSLSRSSSFSRDSITRTPRKSRLRR